MVDDFKKIIDESQLAEEDTKMWHRILSFAAAEVLEVFRDFIGVGKDKNERLVFLTNNIRLKADSFAQKNSQKFKEVLESERDSLTLFQS